MKQWKLDMLFGRLLLLGLAVFVLYSCQKDEPLPRPVPTSAYNFDAVLHSIEKGNFSDGLLEFRQDPDTDRVINLNVWVHGLEPNHDYSFQRAVNPITDADCTSTTWLTLGQLLVPYPIHTDEHGNGFAPLSRNVSSTARGTEFRIHFQVIDNSTLATVLVSDCEQYTVR